MPTCLHPLWSLLSHWSASPSQSSTPLIVTHTHFHHYPHLIILSITFILSSLSSHSWPVVFPLPHLLAGTLWIIMFILFFLIMHVYQFGSEAQSHTLFYNTTFYSPYVKSYKIYWFTCSIKLIALIIMRNSFISLISLYHKMSGI